MSQAHDGSNKSNSYAGSLGILVMENLRPKAPKSRTTFIHWKVVTQKAGFRTRIQMRIRSPPVGLKRG